MMFDIQLAAKVHERYGFYDVFWGYFDQKNLTLKVLSSSWASGSKQILVGSVNKCIVHFGQGVSKL